MTRRSSRSVGRQAEPHEPTEPADSPPPDQAAAARNLMLRKLAARARTRGELADLLAERGIATEVAGQALDRFTEVGLIDDSAFASDFVALRSGGRGRAVLRQELLRRGVATDVVAEALSDLTPEHERAAAERFAARRWQSMASLEPAVRVRRLSASLVRRGFAPGLAFDVISELEQSRIGVAEDL